MSKYRTLAGRMQGISVGTSSSSGSSSIASVSSGVSAPSHAGFWREVQNELKAKIQANGGKANVQFYDEALAQIEPFLSDSQYQQDYLSLSNDRSDVLQKQEDARFEATTTLQNFEKRKLENQIKNFGNPNSFLTGLWDSYDQSLKEIDTKKQDYAYLGLDTSALDKAQQEILTKLEKDGDQNLLKKLAANGFDVSQMPGYAWQVQTSPVDGSVTGFSLVPESDIKDNFAFTNAEWAGRPVYVSKAVDKGKEYVPLQGHQFAEDPTTKQWITDTQDFDLRKVRFDSYPTNVPVNSAARDTSGNVYYRGKDKWYKVDGLDTLNSLINTSGMGTKDYTNTEGDAYKSLPVLLDENVWTLGNFDKDNTLTADQVLRPSSVQPITIDPIEEIMKAKAKKTISDIGFKNFSATPKTISQSPVLTSMQGFEQNPAITLAAIQPRKGLSLQPPRAEESIQQRTEAIMAGGRATGRR